MTHLFLYITLKIVLSCPIGFKSGEKETIFVGVLANRSIMNISLDCRFNLRTKEIGLMKYLNFSHFVSFAGDSFPSADLILHAVAA